jgi:Ca-activated chloride channel family protein
MMPGDWLAGLGVDGLSEPGRLPWLCLAALAVLAISALRRRDALAWPGMREAERAGASRLELAPSLAWLLRASALALLALVVARPVALHRAPPEPGHGLDLVLVLDTSGSMRALDASIGGRANTRIELARRVVSRFAAHRVAEGDRVGLVVFGETAFTQCPLTSDGTLLEAALGRVQVGVAGESTALGDALALAVKRAVAAGRPRGRVVVLLTDGRSNTGGIPLDVAANLAGAAGIRVHAVGIGSRAESVAMAARPGVAAETLERERHQPDFDSLERVARATGGRLFLAAQARDLDAVYGEIDAIERTERVLPPRVRQRVRAEPLLAMAGGLIAFEIALVRVWRRRIP